jgi:hypothetical protein
LLLCGAAAGLAYGLLLRASAQFLHGTFLPIMTVALLFLLPFAMGFVSVFLVERREVQPIWVGLLLPLLPFAGGIAASMLALWEGVICVVLFAPMGIGLAVLGGIAGGLSGRYLKTARSANITLASVMILPIPIGP